jgi:hypothetical protein
MDLGTQVPRYLGTRFESTSSLMTTDDSNARVKKHIMNIIEKKGRAAKVLVLLGLENRTKGRTSLEGAEKSPHEKYKKARCEYEPCSLPTITRLQVTAI